MYIRSSKVAVVIPGLITTNLKWLWPVGIYSPLLSLPPPLSFSLHLFFLPPLSPSSLPLSSPPPCPFPSFLLQSAVKAALEGRLLILEGIEKAERNVLPVLNNLLENREMQLEDGRFLMAPERYDKLVKVHTTTLSLELPLRVYLLAGLGTHTSLLKVVSVVSYVGAHILGYTRS